MPAPLPAPISTEPTLPQLSQLIVNVLGVAARLLGIAAFVMLVVGGFQMLTAAGDPKKTEQAQKTITSAVVGLLLVVGGWMALNILERLTGAKLTIFNLCITGSGINCE